MADLLHTPLYSWHVAHGARMVDFAGYSMPVQYKSIVDEHQAVRRAVGLFDISHMGRLLFNGPDTERFLQHVFTNDIASMAQGQVRYGLLLNDEAGILDDVLVYKLEQLWLMVVNASNRAKVVRWFNDRKQGFNVRIEDQTATWGMIALQGPKALPAAEALLPGSGTLKYYYAAAGADPVSSTAVILSRTGYTGEDGFEFIADNAVILQLVEHLCGQEMARHLGCSVTPCGLGARDTLRLEAAMPLYGHELNEQIDPLQAGLGWAVKLNKGDFLGRAALLQRQTEAARPVRVGLELEGKRAAREGYPILQAGQAVGTVTSGAFTPTLQKAIAMGYVPPAQANVGTSLAVDVRGQAVPARVVKLPFYTRKKT